MLKEIAYTPILGLPVLMWGGILTFLVMVTAAVMAHLNLKQKFAPGFKWHVRLAILAFIMALSHGLLAILSYFGK
jgi:hypothetical protein